MLLLPAAAGAHPFGASTAAHRTEVTLGPDEVRIAYTAQVPNAVLQANARLRPGADPLVTTTSELVSGMLLLVDGVRAELVSQGGAEVRRDDDAHTIQLVLTAPLPSDARRVELSNGNLPEVTTYSSAVAWVRPGLEVVDSSLLQVDRGRVLRDDSGRWFPGDQGRRFTVDVTRRDGPGHRLARWVTHTPSDPIPLGHALAPGPGAAFRAGRPTAPAVAAMLILAVMLGLTAAPGTLPAERPPPLRGRLARLALGAAVAGGAACLGWLLPPTGGAWLELGLGALTLLAVAGPPPTAWLGLAALAGAAHAPRLALLLIAIGVVGSALRLDLPPQAHRPLLAITGAWIVVRGLLGLA